MSPYHRVSDGISSGYSGVVVIIVMKIGSRAGHHICSGSYLKSMILLVMVVPFGSSY